MEMESTRGDINGATWDRGPCVGLIGSVTDRVWVVAHALKIRGGGDREDGFINEEPRDSGLPGKGEAIGGAEGEFVFVAEAEDSIVGQSSEESLHERVGVANNEV